MNIRYLITVCTLLSSVSVLSSCTRSTMELSGVVVYGHEARTVQLCGEQQLLWLHTTPELHAFLETESRRLTQRPYQELYLDFVGSMMSDPLVSFPESMMERSNLKKSASFQLLFPIAAAGLRPLPESILSFVRLFC